MKKQIELLAPAGSVEALHAAVENGADAVYLGGKLFNARQQADNFDIDVLKNSLEYAHARGASIYLTLNTLVSDDEMKEALIFAASAYKAGIDGIIVQDLGLAGALHYVMPDVPLHASTQMTIYDIEGVRALEEMGFKRVVLARELALEEATKIAHNTELEVEIFVHGALCVCYSGQCLMSSMIGGRSGNRGRCAQPCRLPYSLMGNITDGKKKKSTKQGRYLLSPKDICTLGYMDQIVASGIKSLKIEGRMKSPEYVATVVRIYRKYLDKALGKALVEVDGEASGKALGKAPDKADNAGGLGGHPEVPAVDGNVFSKDKIESNDMHDLLQIFNRGGFSTGYLEKKSGRDMMCFDKPNNSGIYLGRVISYDGRNRGIRLKLKDKVSIGDGIEIWTGRMKSPGGTVTSIKKCGNAGWKTSGYGLSASKGLTGNIKSAGKGEEVVIGDFKGSIAPGDNIYKTLDNELIKAARESYTRENNRRIDIKGHFLLRADRPIELKVEDRAGNKVSAFGRILPQKAIHKPLTEERLTVQLNKTGSTPFIFSGLSIDTEEGLTIPVSEINEVRRKALDSLLNIRAARYEGVRSLDGIDERIEIVNEKLGSAGTGAVAGADTGAAPRISLYFYRWDRNMDYGSLGADRVYLPLKALNLPGFKDSTASLRKSGAEVFGWLPPVTRGNIKSLIDKLPGSLFDDYTDTPILDGILAGNIGTLQKLKYVIKKNGAGCLKLAGDIYLNIFNTLSFYEANKEGLDSIALSAEMTLSHIAGLKYSSGGAPLLETAVYGRLPLMVSEYCPVGSVEGGFSAESQCSRCCKAGTFSLKDRMGVEFPVLCDSLDCRSTILNSKVLFAPDALISLRDAGVVIFRLCMLNEEPDEIRELVMLHRDIAAGCGNWMDTHGKLIENIKSAGFTKGYLK